MTIYNIGSINIDNVYRVAHLPQPGETVSARNLLVNLGGKGLNISVAATRAGAKLRHIGAVGAGDVVVRKMLADVGLDDSRIVDVDAPTGHANIYVGNDAENMIVILPGANACISEHQIAEALQDAEPGDWLVLQNETNANEIGLKHARAKGMKVALVAAPFDGATLPDLIDRVDLVSLNQSELSGYEASRQRSFRDQNETDFLITYGAEGSEFVGKSGTLRMPSRPVQAVDTTGAGDTYFGAFLARYAEGASLENSMGFASAMAALQVQRVGAASAIPHKAEVDAFMKEIPERS